MNNALRAIPRKQVSYVFNNRIKVSCLAMCNDACSVLDGDIAGGFE